MKRIVIGLAVFGGAVAFALGIYWLTLPDGLPWGVETAVAGRYALPLCAVAAGCLGAVANRYFGWKVGAAAAIAWTLFPRVWNGAILGERMAAYAAFGAIGLWALNAIGLWVTRCARPVQFKEAYDEAAEVFGTEARIGKVKRIVSWSVLGAAGIFAIASLWLHDYRLGEPASVYARGVVESVERGERIIVLNGVADEQVVEEVEKRGGGGDEVKVRGAIERVSPDAKPNLRSKSLEGCEIAEGLREQRNSTVLSSTSTCDFNFRTISLRNDDAYREKIVAWVKREWPAETNLWVAAQVGMSAFLDAAITAHPERFYLMNGDSTTLEQWERRWAAFEPYLKSSDRFVPVGRRAFAVEGNAVGNALQETDKEAAWKLYGRIANEVDRDNISALVNMGEMLRKGYKTTEREKEDVRKRCDAFLANKHHRRYLREMVQAAGPVKADPEMLAKMAEARQKRVEEAKAKGEKLELTPEAKDLIGQNDVMVEAANRGDLETAGKIARKILSNPKWRGWVPANAMLGNVAVSKGDYAEAEAFYRVATSGKNETPEVIWNNYADTLLHLGKIDEAEAILRRRIAKTDEKAWWVLRFTLAEVLTAKVKTRGQGQERIEKEVRELVMSVMKNAPAEYQREVRAKQKTGAILK